MSFDELIAELEKHIARHRTYGRLEHDPELRGQHYGFMDGVQTAIRLIRRLKNELRTSDSSEVPAL